jgi:hypothetical protein
MFPEARNIEIFSKKAYAGTEQRKPWANDHFLAVYKEQTCEKA